MARLNITDLLAQITASPDDAQRLVSEYLAQNPDVDLSAIEDAALDASNDIYGDGTRSYSDEDLAQLSATRALFDQVSATRTEREQQAAERAAQARDLRIPERPAPENGNDGGDGEGNGEAAGSGAAGEAAPEPADTPAAEPVPATASAGQNLPERRQNGASGDFARLATGAATGNGTAWTMTASADINGIPAGANLPDFDALADAVTRRLEPMKRLGPNIKQTVPIASLALTRDATLVAASTSDQGIRRLVDNAADERRLEGGSLTAAGVWCAPSETVYDLCPDLATTDGLINMPSITVTRGGIRYPQSPDYSEVYATMQAGTWEWDPDSDTNDPKPCTTIPCPDYDECRLSPYGLCIQTDILVNHAWPELVNDWTQRILTAQRHLVNSRIISKMVAAATPVAFAGADGAPYQPGGTPSILDTLELEAVYLRTKHRMRADATLEVVLPSWVRPFLRADLAKRPGVDLVSVNDSRVDSYFRDRHLAVQYVYDFQDLDVADGAPASWPTQFSALMYPAGTYVLADQAVIELSGVYDSTQLANNKFTGLFAESAECVIKRCYEALYITIDVCADGVTTAPQDVVCPTI